MRLHHCRVQHLWPCQRQLRHLTHRLLFDYLDRPGAQPEIESLNPASDEPIDDVEPLQYRPRHDVSYVPDYPTGLMCSGLKRDHGRDRGKRLKRDRGGGGGAMLILDDAGQPPVAFSAGLPGGIQLSSLHDPRNVHEATAVHEPHNLEACPAPLYQNPPNDEHKRHESPTSLIHNRDPRGHICKHPCRQIPWSYPLRTGM